MNFVQQLEECLRDLAAEARKQHPGVKEASERATLKLRTLQNQYVRQVRAANAGQEHPTTAVFQSSDLLHPFLLAANYPNASSKLLEISFRAVRLLLEADAIVPTDGMHMVRVWTIQGQVVQAYYQKTYAKEVSAAAAAVQAVQDATQERNKAATAAATATSSGQGTTSTNTTSSSSSWFGSWGNGSSSSSAVAVVTAAASETMSAAATTVVSKTKNAVSSSTGQTGSAHSTHAPKEMEKLALEILSGLLQLLERLKKYPTALTTEMWTNSVAAACLWWNCLPAKHTVQQAAVATVSQILSILYQQAADSSSAQLQEPTWQDLLTCAVGGGTDKNTTTLTGAFSHCRLQQTSPLAAAIPPSPEFALELMTQLWRRDQMVNAPSAELITRSLGVTVRLLQQIGVASVEKSLRILQWTVAVLETTGRDYPTECRELFKLLIRPLATATDACRSHDDFEDGFVYTREEAGVVEPSSGLNGGKDARRRTSTTVLASLIPTTVLWKAAMVLEGIYMILEQDPQQFLAYLQDGSSMASLAESLSDFATIGASCREHMLQLVEFCQDQSSMELDPTLTSTAKTTETKPTVFRKAEQLVTTGAASSLFAVDSSSRTVDRKAASTPPLIMGEALWIAFKGILRIAESMRGLEEAEGLLEETFAPILAVLQHYLKRFTGSAALIELSLTGYRSLAEDCLPLEGNALQRKALLASLCKLSLPSWGKHDASCQLQDHHVRALLCLLRIVHVHYEHISSGWQTVLWTLEELSVLAIASPLLSDRAYQGALAVSIVYGRLAAFSTCFSNDSVNQFTEALAEISISLMENRDLIGGSEAIMPERATPSDIPDKAASDSRGYISEKIMTIGVRAIYGSNTDKQESDDVPIAERTKNTFYEDYRREFVQRITASKSNLRVPSMGRMPFALALLVDTAMANSFRHKECGESTSLQLSRLAASSTVVQAFAMDTMALLTMHHISKEAEFPTPFIGPGSVLYATPRQHQLWATESSVEASGASESEASISHAELIAPLCASIRTTEKADVAEAALGALNAVLEGSGHNLKGEVWAVLINAVSSLSGDPSYVIDRSAPEWSKCCLLAFGCLKLIVNDFLDQLPTGHESSVAARSALLDCCSSFGSSCHAVNTSLTAIGLLWTIADQDTSADALDRALSKLVLLASDSRAEVRNCAVNTLVSCVVGRGSGFSPAQWESCISETIFSIYDLVVSKTRCGEAGEAEATPSRTKASRYTVAMHHSRDSTGKQWVATQVLVMRGLIRVLRSFFSQLLDTVDTVVASEKKNADDAPWFQDAWVRILDYAFEAVGQGEGRDALDIRSVGVEMLTVACQLASKEGIQAATTPASVGTHMEVVNGALRSVRGPLVAKAKELKSSHSRTTEISRQNLFLEAFDSLESFLELLEKEAEERKRRDLELLEKEADEGKKMMKNSSNDTRVQILHKFSSGLSKLNDCCKDSEFAIENAQRSLNSLANESVETGDEDLEPRFVKIVSKVTRMACFDPKARFLNQAQRASLDLLKSMASDGSSEAFKELISLAGKAFFVQKDQGGDDSHSDGVEEAEVYSLINFEAAAVVSEEMSSEDVSDECRVFVLAEVLSDFSLGADGVRTGKVLPRMKRCYKLIIPVIVQGLQSSSRLGRIDVHGDAVQPGDLIWLLFRRCLTELLTPAPVGKDLLKIPRVVELCQIVSVALENAPRAQAADVCCIISLGASKALEVAALHDAFSKAHADTDLGRKSKKHRAEALTLFSTCFKGCCALRSDEPALRSIAEQVLNDASEAAESTTNSKSSVANVRIEAALIVCQTMQKQRVESLVVAAFPLLCKLVTCRDAELRDAVSSVFAAVDVTEILESAHSRYAEAERRAQDAEERVEELDAEVDELKRKLAALGR